ncbi:MAG TPA: oligosaccharide flippase family protein [Puia sp.]|nr:oligosaccharide flippase family protein [Puia sp.]
MIRNRFFRNVSYNTFQLITNQIFGLIIFYGLSRGLDKNLFGEINWVLAVLLAVFGLLTLGIDQVVVKKIAAGYNRQSIFSIYLFHVIVSGGIFYFILLAGYFFLPSTQFHREFLLFIGLGKLLLYISTPFKQLALGLEKFREFFFMSIVSNITRGLSIIVLLVFHKLTVFNILIVFVAGDLAELAFSALIGRPPLKGFFGTGWSKRRQILIMKESLPQAGVVLFTSIMARFDWIIVGLLISATKLAEYSFAYKIFEVSSLPLLIVAPIMIPLFTRMTAQLKNMNDIFFFLEWQIIIASFVALMLNICWIPVVDHISDGKYGSVNSNTIFLLSLSMPLIYFANFMWTIQFAKGNMKTIFTIIGFSFVINLLGCLILIPIYKNEGAAAAYFITILTQVILYLRKRTMILPNIKIFLLLFWPVTAFLAGYLAFVSFKHTGVRVFVTSIFFLSVILISKQASFKNWKTLQSLYQ